jgi:predicted MFS family arabinose efflux permease
MGSALSVNSFVLSTFAPYLLTEFNWSKSDWAAMGAVSALVILFIPIAGRLADRFGVRSVAGVGIVMFPLTTFTYSLIGGDIRTFFFIFVGQTILCCTTTATIYTRAVAEKFVAWRGLALAVCALSPPLVGAVGSPLISAFVADHGWRAGFMAVAGFSAVCGISTLLLLPAPEKKECISTEPSPSVKTGVFRSLARQPLFWMLLLASFMVSLHHAIFTNQIKLVVLEQGANDATAAILVSVFGGGAIAGRLISGVALDYLRPNFVAAFFLGMPAFGLLLLASDFNSVPALVAAFLLVGLAYGGEGDILGYLVVRYFGIEVYSTVLGCVTAAIGAAIALGAVLLSITLKGSGTFNTFLICAAIGVALGSLIFLSIGQRAGRRNLDPEENSKG